MKAKETKNYKKLVELHEACEKENDSLFSIYSSKSDDVGILAFSNDASCISNGLTAIIRKAVNDKPDKTAVRIMHALLKSIQNVLSEDDVVSERFIRLLSDTVAKGIKERYEDVNFHYECVVEIGNPDPIFEKNKRHRKSGKRNK